MAKLLVYRGPNSIYETNDVVLVTEDSHIFSVAEEDKMEVVVKEGSRADWVYVMDALVDEELGILFKNRKWCVDVDGNVVEKVL